MHDHTSVAFETTRPLSPRTARRHAGRAIRRARREQAQRYARLSATNWTALADGLSTAFQTFGTALTDLAVAFARVTTDITVDFGRTVAAALAASAAEQRRAHRDWMLTYRALEPLARSAAQNTEETP